MKTKELQSVQKCWQDDFKEGKTSVDVRLHETQKHILNASSSGSQRATENAILLSQDTNFESSDSRSGQKGVALREEKPWVLRLAVGHGKSVRRRCRDSRQRFGGKCDPVPERTRLFNVSRLQFRVSFSQT